MMDAWYFFLYISNNPLGGNQAKLTPFDFYTPPRSQAHAWGPFSQYVAVAAPPIWFRTRAVI